MKIQKLAIATVAGTVFLFLLDYLWYGMIMKDSMDMPGARPEPDMMWMVISYIIFSFGFVSIYGGWTGGSGKVNSGMNFGLLTGVMVGLGLNLMWYSLSTAMTLSETLVDAGYSIVKYLLLGILVAFLSASGMGDRQGGGKIGG